MTSTHIALAAMLAAAAYVAVRFEQVCLRDLADTPDDQLRLFTRTGWAALILFCIPIGGLLYLLTGKWQ